MAYSLGNHSLANLSGVHPKLVAVVKEAIKITQQDFTVFEGLRTPERQAEYLRRGVTKTAKSKHLRQADGYGHAVDLVPWIDGGPRWEWALIWDIADAVRFASLGEGVTLVWGGVWDRRLQLTTPGVPGLKADVADYCTRHPGPDFLDGPHFQLESYT